MTERKTVYKWFWVWDFEKEERWLNEMALDGWALVGVGWCRYTFERTEPGEYTIRLEMRAPDESYLDYQPSYASNEVTINWNVTLFALSAGIDALFENE